ncbi:hypothetical protein LCGC14_0725120 [marine sediment metagenome]|uniref:Uncharacterized protein n=1 Tax=marine sediment metagenome TaxID=412755 RepID=A0A0F9TIK7_9ZZZZ
MFVDFPYAGRKIGEVYGYCGPCSEEGPLAYQKIDHASLVCDNIIYTKCDDCKVLVMRGVDPEVGRQVKANARVGANVS